MEKFKSFKGGAALVLAAVAAAGAVAAYVVATASADGRALDASFCSTVTPPSTFPLCMQVASPDGTAQGFMGGSDATDVLTLRPGTYWLTVTDNSNGHNFELRSCPGAAVLCDENSGGDVDLLTPVVNPAATPTITDTEKILLKQGTYRIFCNAQRNLTSPTHEQMGMFVDLVVGGVGQVG